MRKETGPLPPEVILVLDSAIACVLRAGCCYIFVEGVDGDSCWTCAGPRRLGWIRVLGG